MQLAETKFLWTDECQNAFDRIKALLSCPPILRMPDMVGMFRLMSDTNILAAGAALYQYQGSAFYIVGYNSKKLPKAVQNYSVTELELFGLVINIYAFRQLLTNVYFEVFSDHSAIAQILNGKKKLPIHRIQRLIEHLLPFNFTVQYLPGEKMHIADILSRLAGKDLESSDQLIPISFNVLTRTNRTPTQPLKLYTADKHKQSQLPHSYVPPQNNLQEQSVKPQVTTSKPVQTKTIHTQKKLIPSSIQALLPKPTTISTLPPVPLGILRKSSPVILPTPQTEVRKSLVNPHLKIPQSLPLLDLPPPDPKETLEMYRPPDESLFRKSLPVLKDAKEVDVFTRLILNKQILTNF